MKIDCKNSFHKIILTKNIIVNYEEQRFKKQEIMFTNH